MMSLKSGSPVTFDPKNEEGQCWCSPDCKLLKKLWLFYSLILECQVFYIGIHVDS